MQYILGVTSTVHDSSASIIKNGEIIAAAREERFDRKKYSGVFPINAIKYCLKKANISLNEIEYIIFPDRPYIYLFHIIPHLIKYFPKTLNFLRFANEYLLELSFKIQLKKKFKLKKLPKIKFILNHISHAAGAFYLSPFKKSAIFSADGVGTYNTVWMGLGDTSGIKKLINIKYPHSLGFFYSTFTQFLGFKHSSDEYKVMALPALGAPTFEEKIKRLIRLKINGKFTLDLSYFQFHTGSKILYSDKLAKLLGVPPRNSSSNNNKIDHVYYDIACSMQKVFEDTIFNLLNILYKKTGCNNLCISGGVGMNTVLNGKIKENTPFKNLFVQPSCDDAGCSLGASLYLYNKLNPSVKKLFYKNIEYLGPEYDSSEIKAILDKYKIKFNRISSLRQIAVELKRGKIIGLFDGRMEFSPRALGNRSILADCRNIKMKEKLNRIKGRESFRPLAPAILEEFAPVYFENFVKNHFMTMTVKVKKDKQKLIPAVVHYDGTARPQTVPVDSPTKLRKILEEYYNITGIPVLINTSFNFAGEPIVCTPEDAIKSFLKMDIDILILSDYVVYKNQT